MLGFDVVKNISPELNDSCIIAIGDNQQRAKLFESLRDEIISIISNRAYIGKNARIAKGVFIANGAHIGPNAKW